MNLFKEEFKYFRRKNPRPDLSRVMDFSRTSTVPSKSVQVIPLSEESERHIETYESLGLTCPSEWKAYRLVEVDGLIVVMNPFKPEGQRVWMEKCLTLYPRKPNVTNVDIHVNRCDEEDLWQSFHSNDPDKVSFFQKLRWTTLGYHHDWDSKIYSKNSYTPFPPCLEKLSKTVARVFGYTKFQPEAAIINYYHLNSSLSGHTDHSEPYLAAPLFSFSFGQTAVFLIGGRTKDICPIPLFLKSGDIVIMSGESRLSYHGVPLIMKENIKPWLQDIDDALEWLPFSNFVENARINMNVRQVLAPGEELPL